MENQNEELFKKTNVDDTPFTIISKDGKHFGTMGKYRITEEYEFFDSCKIELERITWNRLAQVMIIINEVLNEKEKQ